MPVRCTEVELRHSGFIQEKEEKILAASCTSLHPVVGTLLLSRMALEGESLRWLAKRVVFTAPKYCQRPQTLQVAEDRTVTEVKVAVSHALPVTPGHGDGGFVHQPGASSSLWVTAWILTLHAYKTSPAHFLLRVVQDLVVLFLQVCL